MMGYLTLAHSRVELTVSRPRDTVPTNLRTETPVDGMVAR